MKPLSSWWWIQGYRRLWRIMHVSQVSRRESSCHQGSGHLDTIPQCCKIQQIFYRICFSIADGPLHMFSSHWLGVPGWQCCSHVGTTYKGLLCLQQASAHWKEETGVKDNKMTSGWTSPWAHFVTIRCKGKCCTEILFLIKILIYCSVCKNVICAACTTHHYLP